MAIENDSRQNKGMDRGPLPLTESNQSDQPDQSSLSELLGTATDEAAQSDEDTALPEASVQGATTGQGPRHRGFALPFPLVRGRAVRRVRTPAERARRRQRRIVTWLAVLALLLLANPIINSPVGAWGADVLRATLGPRLTAQIESYYFDVTDAVNRLKAHVFGGPKSAPFIAPKGTVLPTSGTTPATVAIPHRKYVPGLMVLPQIVPIISPSLEGEGQWTNGGLPGPTNALWPVPMAKTFIRPDPSRPYAIVMVVAIDLRQVQLHLVDGTQEPAHGGPGVVAAPDRAASALLAAFNGGFKASDGHFGLMIAGHIYLPPQPGAATLALYADGSVRLGKWGSPAIPTANLIAYRQNGAMLIDQGQVNPSAYTEGYAWGAPILANIYTWRSAIALTSSGVLLYAAGNDVSAATLAKALVAVGAKQAMELDINPVWVRFNTYALSHGTLVAEKLRSDMQGWNNQFLVPYARDFIYVTRVGPTEWATSNTNKGAGG